MLCNCLSSSSSILRGRVPAEGDHPCSVRSAGRRIPTGRSSASCAASLCRYGHPYQRKVSGGGAPQPLDSGTAAAPAGKRHHVRKPLVIAIVVAVFAAAALATAGLGIMNSAGGSVSSDSQSADASGQIDGVSVRNSVNDYSWDELKQISDKIASAASDDRGCR